MIIKLGVGFSALLAIPFLLFLHWLSGRVTKCAKAPLSKRYYVLEVYNDKKVDRLERIVLTFMRLLYVSTIFVFVTALICLELTQSYRILDDVITSRVGSMLDFAVSFVGPFTLTVIALIAFWGTFNKKDCVFFQIEDVYKEKRLKENLTDALLCYCATFLIKTVTIVVPISEMNALVCSFALGGVGLCFWGLLCSVKAITATISMIFDPNDSLKLLNSLCFRVRQKRRKTQFLNKGTIPFEDSLEYLFAQIRESTTNFSNEKICFVDFSKAFNSCKKMPLRIKVATTISVIVIFLPISLYVGAFSELMSTPYDYGVLLLSFLVATIITLALLFHRPKLRDTIVHLHIGSWGFVAKNAKRPFSLRRSHAMDKERSAYLKAVYNIISLFRDMLTASEDDICNCFNSISDFVRNNRDHYIIYTCCFCLLHIERSEMMDSIRPNILLDDTADKHRILKHNTAELMVDILRPESQKQVRNSIKKFIQKVTKA